MDPGLCGACRHAEHVRTATSTFMLCGLSRTDPEHFRKYPRLPVLACDGFDPQGDAKGRGG
ncbi:MAG TPA: hypothetical protein VGR28_15075 [Candidatus Thermoplasmatota archaeon]|jgi:hypothetical protein|nr:hypothetical protein [Candidatus Thermoplasmatota archaeon]